MGSGGGSSSGEFVKEWLAWAAVFAGAVHLLHPTAAGYDIEYRLGFGLPWFRDVYFFALAFGLGMTYLTRRVEQLSQAEKLLKFIRDRDEIPKEKSLQK